MGVFMALAVMAALWRAGQPPALVELPFIRGRLTIDRDEYGLAHVTASEKNELFFGLGWAEAEDRLLRLVFMSRLASGTLAEVFGKEALKMDLFIQNLDFQRYGDEFVEELS